MNDDEERRPAPAGSAPASPGRGWLQRWRHWMTAPPRGMKRPILGAVLGLMGVGVMVLAVTVGRGHRDDDSWHDPSTPWPRAPVLERPHTVLVGGQPGLRAAAQKASLHRLGVEAELIDIGAGAMLLRASVPAAAEWQLQRELADTGIDWPGGTQLLIEYWPEPQ